MSFTIGVNFENKSFRHDETFNGSYRFTYKKIKELESLEEKRTVLPTTSMYLARKYVCKFRVETQ